MRSLLLTLLAVATVAFMLPNALAQDNISLTQETSGTLAFEEGVGGNFTFNLCGKINNLTKECMSGDTLMGGGIATGFPGSPYKGVYVLNGNATQTGTFGGCVGTTCNWTLSGGGLNFNFCQTGSCATDWLSGTLTMTSLTEVPNGHGLFNETIALTLSNIGGILGPDFQSHNGVVTFSVTTQTTVSLAKSPNGRDIQGVVEGGDLQSTPEPGTMALLGSGFLLVGGFLRRKFTA